MTYIRLQPNSLQSLLFLTFRTQCVSLAPSLLQFPLKETLISSRLLGSFTENTGSCPPSSHNYQPGVCAVWADVTKSICCKLWWGSQIKAPAWQLACATATLCSCTSQLVLDISMCIGLNSRLPKYLIENTYQLFWKTCIFTKWHCRNTRRESSEVLEDPRP